MTHKEFYFWLEGYLHGRLEDEHILIAPIVEKMNEVKEVDSFFPNPRTTIPSPFNPIIMPLKKDDDPYKPPFEVYCGTKTQLND
jgi:hypothetical protein